jgi:hypothetical protein
LRTLFFLFSATTIVGFFLRTASAKDVGRPLFGLGFSFLIVFSVFVLLLEAPLAWKRDPSLAAIHSVTITTHGATLATSDRTKFLDWLSVSSAIELKDGFFFVFTGPQTVMMIPKRAIATDQDLTFVRSFVPKPFFRIQRI